LHSCPWLFGIAHIKKDSVGSVLFFDPIKLIHNHIVGLIPGNADETRVRGTLRVGSLHGIFETVRMIKPLKGGIGLGTDGRCGKIGPGLYAGDHITPPKEFYAAKRDFIATITESISFDLPLSF
jgi:hypothetical protein